MATADFTEKVIVDTKVADCFCDEHIAKMIGHLAKTQLDLSLPINFKHATLQWKRVVCQRVFQ